jgi:hypothetical protein
MVTPPKTKRRALRLRTAAAPAAEPTAAPAAPATRRPTLRLRQKG